MQCFSLQHGWEKGGWRDGQRNKNAFKATQDDQALHQGLFVPMSSKGRSTDMQAMLSNSISTFAQEHKHD